MAKGFSSKLSISNGGVKVGLSIFDLGEKLTFEIWQLLHKKTYFTFTALLTRSATLSTVALSKAPSSFELNAVTAATFALVFGTKVPKILLFTALPLATFFGWFSMMPIGGGAPFTDAASKAALSTYPY